MKNRGIHILLSITVLFAAITVSFFLGRNTNHDPIRLSPLLTEATSATAEMAGTEAVPPGANGAQTQPPHTGPVNINTADIDALMTLPGIGEVLAQCIIDYREDNGPFHSLEELINVSGIGPKRLEAILDYATVGG